MPAERPRLYVVDGHAVAYRQYFGLPVAGFKTKVGEPTNAVFGFTRVLMDILEKRRPHYLAVSFDRGLSGRDEMFPEYKGTREKMPDDLRVQMDRLEEVVTAFNIPILAIEGYEADDIIGTVARQAEALGVHTHIVTGDRDILQLLTEHVTVELPAGKRGQQDTVYDIPAFMERYTIRPDQLVDYKALVGDKSDNIPGVAGVGDKTTVNLLLDYETLEGIYDHVEDLKGALKKKMVESRDMAFLSRELARIQQDTPVKLDLASCVAHDFDRETVLELFRELEFRTLTDRLMAFEIGTPKTRNMFDASDFEQKPDEEAEEKPQVDATGVIETRIVRTPEDLAALVDTLDNASAITWDVETTDVDQMKADLVGIALAVDGAVGYYVPVGHESGEQLPLQRVIDAVRPALENASIPKYAHNAPYDAVVMQRYGVQVAPVAFDTMVGEWLRNPISKHLGLKNLALHELGIYMTPISDLIGKGRKQITMDRVDIVKAAPYAAADAAITHRLAEILEDDLKDRGLKELNESLELPLIPVIVAMEQAGVALDVPYLREMGGRLEQQLDEIKSSIYDLSGGYGEFNINSTKQLNDVLFDRLGLPVAGLRRRQHGYSTDAAALEKLKHDAGHPIIDRLLEYRELSKLYSAYVDALPKLVNPYTGRVHTSFNQTGSATGRLSSASPNLQNIPIRTEIGREVRRAFVAPEGKVLLGVDYSQIELRVLAHMSQDQTLLDAFAQDQDIHAATAAAVNNIPVEDVTYDQRSFAKRVNFGLIYGMGAFRLARESDLTLAEAQAFIETYFERMPRVQDYIENTKRQARQPEGVSTLFGRRRYFASLQNAGDGTRRQTLEAEQRAAVNMPIQGTAADIMKRAMINLHHELIARKLDAMMILQVHDELVLEVDTDQIDATRALVVEVMEDAYTLDAPLKANAQIGLNWRDMHDEWPA